MADVLDPGSLALFVGAHGAFLALLVIRGLFGRFAGV